jgi:hypothetical protein
VFKRRIVIERLSIYKYLLLTYKIDNVADYQ